MPMLLIIGVLVIGAALSLGALTTFPPAAWESRVWGIAVMMAIAVGLIAAALLSPR